MAEFKSFDGVRIHFDDVGEGPPVLLLHGFASDTTVNWIVPGVRDALAAAGFRVISPDARGHGRSEKPHAPESYADDAMRRDVSALSDYLGLERVDAVGYSMGAVTAR